MPMRATTVRTTVHVPASGVPYVPRAAGNPGRHWKWGDNQRTAGATGRHWEWGDNQRTVARQAALRKLGAAERAPGDKPLVRQGIEKVVAP